MQKKHSTGTRPPSRGARGRSGLRNRAGYARPSSIASLPTCPLRPPPAGATPAPPGTAVPDAVPAPAPATVPEPPDTQCEFVRLLFATPPQHSTQRRCSIFFTLPGPNSERGCLPAMIARRFSGRTSLARTTSPQTEAHQLAGRHSEAQPPPTQRTSPSSHNPPEQDMKYLHPSL